METSSQQVLYFYTAESPFISKDIEILRSRYKVKIFHFNLYNKKGLALILVRQMLFLLRNILISKITITQFAGLHSVLPVLVSKLFFRKSVLVAGGTDCVSFPSIHYGNFSEPLNAKLTAFSFRHASLILPVHETLIDYSYTYQNQDLPRQGLRNFVPGLKTKIEVVFNGYDSSFWSRGEAPKEKATFITVLGHVNPRFTFKLKGIDLIVEAARAFPDAGFSIVGGIALNLEKCPANLKLLPNIWGEELVKLFAGKRFYVQLSMSEGFPNALSEAMLCECVPIVSAVGAMPFIAGEDAFVLRKKDNTELVQLIRNALEDKDLEQKGKHARSRVKELFTFEKRKAAFLNAVDKL
ncbi:MAG TPA: glycosyltransferase family 4 protein [Bacteroidia bacterium]|nr:glycosyltransferase family 4 protein [Bacteroidia bacterium]